MGAAERVRGCYVWNIEGAPDLDRGSKEDDMATWDQHWNVPQDSEQNCGWGFSNRCLDSLDPVNRQSDVK